jgi:CheY-like chemotaxis protein
MAILVVDDDTEARERLCRSLHDSGDGWAARPAATAKEALALVTAADVECVLLDYRLPDADGLTCLREVRRLRPDVPVVMVTGEARKRSPSRR